MRADPQVGSRVPVSTTAPCHGNSNFLASSPFTIRSSRFWIPHTGKRRWKMIVYFPMLTHIICLHKLMIKKVIPHRLSIFFFLVLERRSAKEDYQWCAIIWGTSTSFNTSPYVHTWEDALSPKPTWRLTLHFTSWMPLHRDEEVPRPVSVYISLSFTWSILFIDQYYVLCIRCSDAPLVQRTLAAHSVISTPAVRNLEVAILAFLTILPMQLDWSTPDLRLAFGSALFWKEKYHKLIAITP